jgi:hypothetical protein
MLDNRLLQTVGDLAAFGHRLLQTVGSAYSPGLPFRAEAHFVAERRAGVRAVTKRLKLQALTWIKCAVTHGIPRVTVHLLTPRHVEVGTACPHFYLVFPSRREEGDFPSWFSSWFWHMMAELASWFWHMMAELASWSSPPRPRRTTYELQDQLNLTQYETTLKTRRAHAPLSDAREEPNEL